MGIIPSPNKCHFFCESPSEIDGKSGVYGMLIIAAVEGDCDKFPT